MTNTKTDRPDINIDQVLAERGEVAIVWSVEDVKQVRPHLQRAEAWQVLERCRDEHDCEYGFTWHFIEEMADAMFPKPKKSRSKTGGEND